MLVGTLAIEGHGDAHHPVFAVIGGLDEAQRFSLRVTDDLVDALQW